MHDTNQHQTPRRVLALRSSRIVLAACSILAASLAFASQEARAQVLSNATNVGIQQQQQQQQANALQTQLNQIQQQAQRQLNQLNGMVLNAVNNSSSRYSNVLEAISSVGKVIHQQISAATNPNHVNIITNGPNMQQSGLVDNNELANNKKNEYQAIQMGTEMGPSFSYGSPNGSTHSQFGANNANYREQGEFLRQEIGRRAGQLQQVVASSMDLLKNNGDMIMRRLLEQMNVRLDQAKAKADKIITNDPVAMNEVTVKALATINSGLNNLNNIISNIVTRMDLANKQDQQQQQQQQQQQRLNQPGGLPSVGQTLQQRLQQAAADPALPPLLDTTRFKANLHQLSQQFQQALNGSSLHQQLALIRNQRLQQQALTSPMGANQAKVSPVLTGSGPTLNYAQQAQQKQQQR